MKNLGIFGAFALFLTLCFSGIIYKLVVVAADSELHSHILLIPFLAGFLMFRIRGRLPSDYVESRGIGLVLAGAGIGLGIAGFITREVLSTNDVLSVGMASYLSVLAGGMFYFLGKDWVKVAAFPLFFLLFLIPLPDAVVSVFENFLVRATALILEPSFQIAGIPALREGQVFHIPGITIEVARQCSGIRSTLVLMIVGILAAFMFLQSPRFRVLLIALLIPLGILRNVFRILVISALCVYRDPEMINSPVHRDGGPWFFGVSLVALATLVWILRRLESFRSRQQGRNPRREAEDSVIGMARVEE